MPTEQPVFDEDFFQRIKNVHWLSEPEVFWMAGDGCPSIINGDISGSIKCGIYTSDNGVKWTGTSADGKGGFNAFYSGGWMRQNLKEDGAAIWVMTGVFNDTHPNATDLTYSTGTIHAATTFSVDGVRLVSRQEHDHRHFIERLRRIGSDKVGVTSEDAFNFHEHIHTSPDGRIWTPTRFHQMQGGGGSKSSLALAAAPSVSRPTRPGSLVRVGSSMEDIENPTASISRSDVGVTPFAEATGTIPGNKRVFIAGVNAVRTGKIRKEGPFEGQTITMELASYDARKGYSGSKINISNKDGRAGTTDCGLKRTYTINYGHYVFCVGGETLQKPNRGAIAYTEDGKNWGVSYMNDNPVLVLAVGPRK